MTEAFNDWWDAPIDMTDNPYRQDSAAYWAWAGWMAGVKAEQDRCCALTEDQLDDIAVVARRGNLYDLRMAIERAHEIGGKE